MNKLTELLNDQQDTRKEAFDKSFRKVFGIPAEINHDKTIGTIYNVYDQTFSLDAEGTLLWYLNDTWHRITTLEEARQKWRS